MPEATQTCCPDAAASNADSREVKALVHDVPLLAPVAFPFTKIVWACRVAANSRQPTKERVNFILKTSMLVLLCR